MLRRFHTQWCPSSAPALYIYIYMGVCIAHIIYIIYILHISIEQSILCMKYIERCWWLIIVENEVIVGAAVTGDAPTTSELASFIGYQCAYYIRGLTVVTILCYYYSKIINKHSYFTPRGSSKSITRELRCSKLSVTVQTIVQANSKKRRQISALSAFCGNQYVFYRFRER